MRNNNTFYFFFLIIAFIFIIQGAGASGVIVTGYEIQPSVLMPGGNGIITATLTNTGQPGFNYPSETNTSVQRAVTETAIIDSVFLDGNKNIQVIRGNSQFEGSIGPGQSIQVSFFIRAPEKSGIYFPELHIRIRNQESVLFPIPVNVNTAITATKKPALLLSYSTEDRIKPGSNTPVNITVMNLGKSNADDIIIKISDEDPMVASRSSSSGHVTQLDPGSSSHIPLLMTIDKNARSGIHEIPIVVQYITTDGLSEQFTDSITLDVRGEAGMSIASLSTDPVRISQNEPFDLIIRLENTGTADARSVRGTISLPFAGSKEAFIGTIEPNSDAPAVFVLTAGTPGDYSYNLTVTYEDDWGDHAISDTLMLTITAKESGIFYFIGIIIILILAVLGYRIFSRRGM